MTTPAQKRANAYTKIKAHGALFQLTRTARGYDPRTSRSDAGGKTTGETYAADDPDGQPEERFDLGSQNRGGDLRVIVSALDTAGAAFPELQAGDCVDYLGVHWKVQACQPVRDSGVIIISTVWLAKG